MREHQIQLPLIVLALVLIVLMSICFNSFICYLKMFVQVLCLPRAMIYKFTSLLSHSFIYLTSVY